MYTKKYADVCTIYAINIKFSNSGFCSEYNTMGKVIQEHYSENCTKHDQPCPIFYNSAESYKCKFKKWLFKMVKMFKGLNRLVIN